MFVRSERNDIHLKRAETKKEQTNKQTSKKTRNEKTLRLVLQAVEPHCKFPVGL